jgi:imidazole glycerol phosphate synthase glutamine amidotransferase subunit
MSNLVGLINYGTAGNIHSVKKALEKAGADVKLINVPGDFQGVPRIVLPGVGSFKEAMEELANDGFIEPIKKFDGPILGICLGMQILSTLGYEHGQTQGLGFIKAEVKPMQCRGKVPHVGFNKVDVLKDSVLFKGVENEPFYFMHSFEVVNYTNMLGLTEYVDHKFVSAIEAEHIYGVQFHPEKSREAGIELFRNFLTVEKA